MVELTLLDATVQWCNQNNIECELQGDRVLIPDLGPQKFRFQVVSVPQQHIESVAVTVPLSASPREALIEATHLVNGAHLMGAWSVLDDGGLLFRLSLPTEGFGASIAGVDHLIRKLLGIVEYLQPRFEGVASGQRAPSDVLA